MRSNVDTQKPTWFDVYCTDLMCMVQRLNFNRWHQIEQLSLSRLLSPLHQQAHTILVQVIADLTLMVQRPCEDDQHVLLIDAAEKNLRF